MTIEVPDGLEGVGRAMQETLAELKGTRGSLDGGKAIDYGLFEQQLQGAMNHTELESHRSVLQRLDVDVPAVIIDGVRYTRVGRCEASYHTQVGSVSIERSLYRQSGQRGGQPGGRVKDPVSLRAGVVGDGWLPGTARVMGHELQKGISREAEVTAREWGRLP